MMRLLLGFCLLVVLTIADAKPESLEIQAGGQKISLPYWPAQGKQPHGGILIVEGGAPWDGSRVLYKLAPKLAKLGWSVALLNANQQTDKAAWIMLLPDVLSNLRQKSNTRTVLLHYGAQLHTLVDYFAKPQSKQVNGLILLSAFEQMDSKDLLALLQKVPFPVFDIIGQFDYVTVLEQAAVRKKNNQNKRYFQLLFPGAAHDYSYTQKMLTAYMHGWMLKLKPTEVAPPPVAIGR